VRKWSQKWPKGGKSTKIWNLEAKQIQYVAKKSGGCEAQEV
jgi:hypothetical protein